MTMSQYARPSRLKGHGYIFELRGNGIDLYRQLVLKNRNKVVQKTLTGILSQAG